MSNILKLKQDHEKQAQELMTANQVFFAFSNEQLAKGMESLNLPKETKLIAIGAGGYMPKANYEKLESEMKELTKKQKNEIKNLKGQHEKLIIDTIYNYEAFYTGDLTDVINELKSYGITAKQIQSVYKKNYHTFDM